MDELALFGGPPAVTERNVAPSPLGEDAVEALLQAAESARHDRAFLSGLSGSGPIAALERDLGSYLGTPYVVAVSSGTSALHAALLAVGVKPGDQVIVPAYTWSQTVAPVIHIGAVPHFVDIEPNQYGLDPLRVARAINARTGAILAVHLYGNPADIVALRQLADAHRIPLIEDCAQAMGATVDGTAVGRHGDAGCFSIGPGKPLSGGEGGFIVTKDRRLYERCVELTQHPIRQHFDLWGGKHSDFGLGCRMHPLAAVIARAELQSLDQRIERRARFFEALGRALHSVPGVHPRTEAGGNRPSNYRYCPSFAPEDLDVPISRQLFVEALRSEGVPIVEDPIALPLHQRSLRPFVGPRGRRPRLPVTEARCQYTGLAFAPDLAETASEKTIGQIREAFQKIAYHADRVLARAQREGQVQTVATATVGFPARESARGSHSAQNAWRPNMKAVIPIVLIALLASACASGGRYLGPRPYPGPLGEVVAGNLALTCPGSVYLGPPINRCAEHVLIGGQPYWGYYDRTGRFTPIYGAGFRLLSTAAGALVGYAVTGTAEGAARGGAAALGAGVAMEVIDTQRRARAGWSNTGRRSVYRVQNPTDYVAEIVDGRQRVALLRPGEQAFISEPKGLLTGRVKIPHGGRLTIVMVELRPVGGTVWEVPQP